MTYLFEIELCLSIVGDLSPVARCFCLLKIMGEDLHVYSSQWGHLHFTQVGNRLCPSPVLEFGQRTSLQLLCQSLFEKLIVGQTQVYVQVSGSGIRPLHRM